MNAKKLLLLALVLVMVFSMAACSLVGTDKDKDKDKEKDPMTSEMVDKDKDGMKDNKCMCGEDGLLIEVHNDPAHALCDGPQSLKQYKVALLQIFRRQRRVDGAAHTRHHHGLLIEIAAEHGVRGARLDALGHRASDEAEADNADCHSLTPLSS